MASQIRIIPAAVRAAAQRQSTLANTIEETSSRLGSLFDRLNAAWDGGASVPALQGLQDLIAAARNIGEGTAAGSNSLNSVAQAFESLDDGGIPFAGVLGELLARGKGFIPAFPFFPLPVLDSIRIIPEEVRSVAAGCKEVAAVYENTASELISLVSQLSDSWEGSSYNRFAEKTHELAQEITELAEKTNEYADRIRVMATRYEELDSSL